MFSMPYLFTVFSKDRQHARLLQLVKQFERHTTLGFSVESFPPLVKYTSSLDYKEHKKELIFEHNGVHVFKTEPIITVAGDVMQKFKYTTFAKDKIFDKEKLHFILEATSKDEIHEDDVTTHLKPLVTVGNIHVDVLAWMISQTTITLLATSTIDNYCLLGLDILNKSLELSDSLQVQQIYSVNYTPQATTGRPPNVLIYTGNNEQSSDKFKEIKNILGQCLDQHKYVIYQLKHDQIGRQPWKENTILLVLATNQIITGFLEDVINAYVENGGKVLSFLNGYSLGVGIISSGLDKELQNIDIHRNLGSSIKSFTVPCMSKSVYEERKGVNILASTTTTCQPIIVSVICGAGQAVMSLVDMFLVENDSQRNTLLKDVLNYLGLVCNDMRKSMLTRAYLLGQNKTTKTFLEKAGEILVDQCIKGNNIDILFVYDDKASKDVQPSQNLLPLVTFAAPDEVSFSFQCYKEHLETNHLGQLLIYSEVVTSTQTILNGSLKLTKKLPRECQPVVVGRQQTIGKGRGGNDWLSPDGCLSFSFPVQIGLNSNLGSRLPFLQHIAALAVVEAVRSLKGYEDLDFRIKWPNDIYFGKETKIGGILVNSSIQGKTFDAVVGIGINLDNSEPTTCINDVLAIENQLHGRKLRKLSREQLLARIMNCMESFMDDFQCNGPKNFVNKYHQRWLHSNARVRLEQENEEVTVKELDDSGFLSVVTSTNDVISLQPDSNSFDMMRNLIAIKTRR